MGLSGDTKIALARFQTIKGLRPTGLMLTDTLNALDVTAAT